MNTTQVLKYQHEQDMYYTTGELNQWCMNKNSNNQVNHRQRLVIFMSFTYALLSCS